MSKVTRILSQIEAGDAAAAEQLLPLVYDELRKLAALRIVQERPGQTLQATALVHEAYLRLVSSAGGESGGAQQFNSRGHFFAAAAEAMRRILVDKARRKGRVKHGGELARRDMSEIDLAAPAPPDEILAVDEALAKLASTNEQAARLVNLRYFAGFSIQETADALGISPRKANQIWAYARAKPTIGRSTPRERSTRTPCSWNTTSTTGTAPRTSVRCCSCGNRCTTAGR